MTEDEILEIEARAKKITCGPFTAQARADIHYLLAECRRLRDVLEREDVQWGSCDACGNFYHCPSCGARSESERHHSDCPIGEALGPKAPPTSAE